MMMLQMMKMPHTPDLASEAGQGNKPLAILFKQATSQTSLPPTECGAG